jgi:penicillin-binding protein 1A
LTDDLPHDQPHTPRGEDGRAETAAAALETFRADLPHSRPRRRRLGGGWKALILLGVVVVMLGAGGLFFVKMRYLDDLPAIPAMGSLVSLNAAPGMTFLDRSGQVIAVRGPRHGRKITLGELPAYVPRAFLAAEDRRYYSHGAVDWWGIGRAAVANWRAGEVVQGGSTLTQQIARTVFLKPDRTFGRKIQEAALASRMERRLTKDQILELYLNRVFFGDQAYGVDAAAGVYFGKSARALTLSEAALLAALPKAPSRLSPANDMPAAIARSHLVLARMKAEGWISQAEQADAIAHPPVLVTAGPEDETFGYVLDMAQAQATKLVGGQAPDLVVRLSVDPGLQATATQVVREVIASQGRRAGARQAALVALGPDGSIRALVGGLDHGFSRFNRAVQAQRQPGSSFKPFVYAAALELGVRPTDTRNDAPVRLGPWAPENYGGGYHGSVTVQDALARSINTVAVRLGRQVGSRRLGEIAARFGLTDIPALPGLSVSLGAYEVNLLELTSAYQVFQQDGRRIPPSLIDAITTSSGQVLYSRPPPTGEQVYDAARAGVMVRMMKGVITHGTGVHAAFGRPAAGKTGTSQTWRDAWFVGFTPDWLCGVWVGDDDNRPMNKVSGGGVPAEIWRRFMLAAHKDVPVRDFPFMGEAPAPAAPAADAERVSDAEIDRSYRDDPPAAPQDTIDPSEYREARRPPPHARSAFYRSLSSEFSETGGQPQSEPPGNPY